MGTANLILGNTLLLAAILLFLAVLPRALRQQKKSALDRAVQKFEKEELKAAAGDKFDENDTMHEKPVPPKDRSLAYLLENQTTSPETLEDGGIPPFVSQGDKHEEKVKIVKEGVPISHTDSTDQLAAPKKKSKLTKQEFSIAPGENRIPTKKRHSDPLKSKTLAKNPKPTSAKGIHVPLLNDDENEEAENNWTEAEIPGLTLEAPRATESSEDIPTFKASQKAKHQSKTERSRKSPQKVKQGKKVKNIVPETEENKNPKPKKQVELKTDPPELEVEISESKPKEVEINAPVVSHRNITKKRAGQEKAKPLSSKSREAQETDAEDTAVSPQLETIKTPPENAKPRPFFLDLKYLDEEELEMENPVSQEKLPADMVDVVIARLNALQIDLENQLISIPGELALMESPIKENTRSGQIRESLPDTQRTINEPSDKKEVSLEELDSFLFTATQRKNTE